MVGVTLWKVTLEVLWNLPIFLFQAYNSSFLTPTLHTHIPAPCWKAMCHKAMNMPFIAHGKITP